MSEKNYGNLRGLPNTSGKKTMRVNKTESNLNLVWEQLDCASGYLYNALDNIGRMVDLPKDLTDMVERIGLHSGEIDSLRDEVESLLE